jgi:hypothetical protein
VDPALRHPGARQLGRQAPGESVGTAQVDLAPIDVGDDPPQCGGVEAYPVA